MWRRRRPAQTRCCAGLTSTEMFVKKIERYAPRFLAFNGKRAASLALKVPVRCSATAGKSSMIGRTELFVLPSTSGAASGFWDARHWHEFAGHVGAPRHEAPRSRLEHRQGRPRPPVLRSVLRRLGLGDARRLRVEDLPRRSDHHAGGREAAADQARLPVRHRHDDLARGRRLHPRGAGRGADRRADGRLQADRGVLRAVRVVRALPAGLGVHPAADPVGRHRRDAEAAR